MPATAAMTPPVVFVLRSDDWMVPMVRFEVDAVPKYAVPDTVSAVEDAYGSCEAVVEVALKYGASTKAYEESLPVEVAMVKMAVLGVVAPIAVLLMVPPEIVSASAISSSTQSKEMVPPSVSAVELTEPADEMVRASEM